MKKTFSVFIFCISLLLFPSALVRADGGSLVPSDNEITVTPSLSQNDIDNANSIGYLFEILRQGGSIDCTNANDDYGLDDLVDDFYTGIWNTWRDLTGATGTVYWLNPFSDDLIHGQETVLMKPNNQLYKTVKPLTNWLRQPREGEDVPVENPDVDYLSYIQIIKSQTFTDQFSDLNNIVDSGHSVLATNFWFNSDNNSIHFSEWGNYLVYQGWSIFTQGIVTVNINEVDGNYNVICNDIGTQPLLYTYGSPYQCGIRVNSAYNYSLFPLLAYSSAGWSEGRPLPVIEGTLATGVLGSYSTLEDALDRVTKTVHHCNLYVNDVPWILYSTVTHDVGIGGVTIVEGTNQPVEYTYDIDIYIPLDDIIDRLDTLIRQKQVITYPDISDLIVDVNGQPAVAVIDVSFETVDDWYVKNVLEYIPIFPLSVSYPVSDSEMVSIIEPAVSVIPNDIITVLGILFIGGLFVCLMQRLLE